MPQRLNLPPDPVTREAVAEAMAKQGVSQVELARRIGWKQPNVSAYLRGVRDVSTRTLALMCEALGLEINLRKKRKRV